MQRFEWTKHLISIMVVVDIYGAYLKISHVVFWNIGITIPLLRRYHGNHTLVFDVPIRTCTVITLFRSTFPITQRQSWFVWVCDFLKNYE
jgi:hypothetical protein